MDQKKIGLFLKELRKEKELTQSQLAEQLNVSDRTVSANYAQTECQFRYCGTAIPFLTVRSTAR